MSLRNAIVIPAALLAAGIPLIAPTQAQAQQGSLLDRTREVAQQIRSGEFKGNFIVSAEQKSSEQVKDLPNFISVQSIGRSRQNPRATDFQAIDRIDLEMGVTFGPKGEITESPTILAITQGESVWKASAKTDLVEKFKSSPGLQSAGVYATSANIPFMGKELPAEAKDAPAEIVARGPKGAKIYRFDTAPQTFIKLNDNPTSDASMRGADARVSGKGYAWFDDEGQLLRLEVDGYGFGAGSTIQYLRMEIAYAETAIQGIDKKLWLPKSSVVAVGKSTSDFQFNNTEYTSYRKFTADSEITFDGLIEDLAPTTPPKRPGGGGQD